MAAEPGDRYNKRLLRAYLHRRVADLQAIIDVVPVFSRRYGAAVDELEEVEDLLQPERE